MLLLLKCTVLPYCLIVILCISIQFLYLWMLWVDWCSERCLKTWYWMSVQARFVSWAPFFLCFKEDMLNGCFFGFIWWSSNISVFSLENDLNEMEAEWDCNQRFLGVANAWLGKNAIHWVLYTLNISSMVSSVFKEEKRAREVGLGDEFCVHIEPCKYTGWLSTTLTWGNFLISVK